MYYRILFHASKKHRSLLFLSSLCLLLFVILVHDLTQTDQVTVQVTEQVQRLLYVLGNETFSAKVLHNARFAFCKDILLYRVKNKRGAPMYEIQ